MVVTDLESRRKKVLEIIVQCYVDTAFPVGSKTVCCRSRLGLSPATIRNVMAELEEMGLVTHPHTSGGRFPTDKGYRFYVESLMENIRLSLEETEIIESTYQDRWEGVEELVERTTRLLSELTKQIGMVLFPRLKKAPFKHIGLFYTAPNKIMVTLVTSSGLVRNAEMEVTEPIEETQLQRICQFMNSQCQGLPLADIEELLTRRLLAESGVLSYLYKMAIEIVRSSSLMEEEDKIYLGGTSYLLEQPDFKDPEKTKFLLRSLEEKKELLELMSGDFNSQGVNVHIGKENTYEQMQSCSLVTYAYRTGGEVLGVLGVIGPTRMHYSKVIPVVEYIGSRLGQLLVEP